MLIEETHTDQSGLYTQSRKTRSVVVMHDVTTEPPPRAWGSAVAGLELRRVTRPLNHVEALSLTGRLRATPSG